MGAFYTYCKYNTRLTSHLFFNTIRISGVENIPKNKPVLLAINHPNSFFDAVIVGGMIPRPTYFLARGDAFKNKIAFPILTSLNMLPVYRLSEGKENLNKNTETFDACHDILEKRQVIIIFAEGLSENNWAMRSLKKGPARIAIKAWNSQTAANELVIVPIGLTYEHFSGAGKNILVNIGKPIEKQAFAGISNEALFVKTFNEKIAQNFESLAYIDPEMQEGDAKHKEFRAKLQEIVGREKSVPAILNYLRSNEKSKKKVNNKLFINWSLLFMPLYAFSTWLTPKIVKPKLFFDSISFGLVMFLWPVYLVILGLVLKAIF